MTKAHVLIVDDEIDILELVTITCARMQVSTRTAESLAEARRRLAEESFDLCLTDMRLPDGDGTELVREIAEGNTGMPVAMITAYGSMDTAVAAMKAGAFDFVNVIELNIPPLRERRDDIMVLAHHILQRIAAGGTPKRLSDEAMDALSRYPFPGNVLGLENVLERATALSA